MFNDKYGLTQAVLEGHKTMTRRFVLDGTPLGSWKETVKRAYYQIGEEIAIAQRYKDAGVEPSTIVKMIDEGQNMFTPVPAFESPGWKNKMFVKAEYMPHRIRITDIKVERLQDISEADIMCEGIMEGEFMNTWDRYYYDHWGDVANHITFRNPQLAYQSLIDRICGKGTWDSNPWVVAYSFHVQRANGFPK
jgi:hypothetical protein